MKIIAWRQYQENKGRNYYIPSGGVLSIQDARTMTAARVEQELARARKRLEREGKGSRMRAKEIRCTPQKNILNRKPTQGYKMS